MKVCNCCNKRIKKGYVIHITDTTKYFCNERCMLKGGFTLEKYEDINKENEGDSYYYEWE